MSDIKKAIKGMIVMSSDLDAMYTSFLNNQLPALWERVSFASLKTLVSLEILERYARPLIVMFFRALGLLI